MAKLTISAISTLTATPAVVPKFDVTPNPNMMPTSQEKAPILLSIKSGETIDAEKFAELFAAECKHFDAVEAFRRINGIGEVLGLCAAECQNVQLGFANLEVNVTGTIPDTNAALNDANKCEYVAIESAAVRKTIAGIETHIPTSVTPADLKRIRDVETGDNKIHQMKPFFIQGLKLTTGGEGEKIELMSEDMSAKAADVEVIDGSSEISVKAKLAKSVAPGRYYLLVTTLAGGETTLYPVGIMATVEGTPDPKIVSIVSGRTGIEGQVKGMDDTITITGADVDFTGARGRYVMVRRDGREDITTSFDDQRDTYEYISPTVMTMKLIGNYSSEPDDNWSSNYLSDEKYLEVRLADGKILRYPMTFING